jgi:hypothetical protein
MSEPTRDSLDLFECPECGHLGIKGVAGGVGEWPGDGKIRCPSRLCEYRTVMRPCGQYVPKAADWVTLPVDIARMAAEHSGRLADIVRICEHEAHADTIDLSAEYLQKAANNESVDWPPVLEDLAARELKWRGLGET